MQIAQSGSADLGELALKFELPDILTLGKLPMKKTASSLVSLPFNPSNRSFRNIEPIWVDQSF